MNWVIFASHLDRFSVNETLDRFGIEYRTLFGCWKGIPEESYMVTRPDWRSCIKNSILVRGQKRILLLSELTSSDYHYAIAGLCYLGKNRVEDLGWFGSCGWDLSKEPNFTLDPITGIAYTCHTNPNMLNTKSAEDLWKARHQKHMDVNRWDWHR